MASAITKRSPARTAPRGNGAGGERADAHPDGDLRQADADCLGELRRADAADAIPVPDEHLVALLGSVRDELLEEMYRRVAAAGYPGLRPSHGCVFRYLELEGSRLSELAEKSGMTKQAFGEHLANVEALGYIVRVPDPQDGRAKLIVPTARGREVLVLGRQAFAEIERDWAATIGVERVAALRTTLEEIHALQR
jgi:DNA-binding MarR family transcriptional regulator